MVELQPFGSLCTLNFRFICYTIHYNCYYLQNKAHAYHYKTGVVIWVISSTFQNISKLIGIGWEQSQVHHALSKGLLMLVHINVNPSPWHSLDKTEVNKQIITCYLSAHTYNNTKFYYIVSFTFWIYLITLYKLQYSRDSSVSTVT